jgi:hypothetical protein
MINCMLCFNQPEKASPQVTLRCASHVSPGVLSAESCALAHAQTNVLNSIVETQKAGDSKQRGRKIASGWVENFYLQLQLEIAMW